MSGEEKIEGSNMQAGWVLLTIVRKLAIRKHYFCTSSSKEPFHCAVSNESHKQKRIVLYTLSEHFNPPPPPLSAGT